MAYKTWQEWFNWYITYKPYLIKDTNPHVQRYMKKGIAFFHGVDKQYHPIVFVQSALLKPSE